MSQDVCWIKTEKSPDDFLTSEMQKTICREDGTLHRLYQALMAWPEPMLPADRFYKAMLHAESSPLGLWKGEFVATYVAILAECAYARAHHGENFLKVSPSRELGVAILGALDNNDLDAAVLDPELRAMAQYTKKLSLMPSKMCEQDIVILRDVGLSEAQVVQVNQIAASFAYWVRMINGLGIGLGEEPVGMAQKSLDKIVRDQSKHTT